MSDDRRGWLRIETARQLLDVLRGEVSGVLEGRPQSDAAHKAFYPGLPRVRLNAEERANLERAARLARCHLRSLQEAFGQLPTEAQTQADFDLAHLMSVCFQIGQQTQYGPALVRSAREHTHERAAVARDKRSLSTRIIAEHLNRYACAHPGSRETSSAIARRIESGVNADLKAANRAALELDSLRKAVDRIRTSAQSSD